MVAKRSRLQFAAKVAENSNMMKRRPCKAHAMQEIMQRAIVPVLKAVEIMDNLTDEQEHDAKWRIA